MKPLKKILFFAMLSTFIVACNNNDDGDNNLDYYISIATVENLNQSSSFLFRLDNNTLMWTSETNLPSYIPKDGQRIIANYKILSNLSASSLYDHDVKLNDVYNVLTKGIFAISPATKDSIGNDSVQIDNMWIGSDYLNVEFTYPGNDKIHNITLVSDKSKVYTDGKVHLDFRHNANADIPTYYKSGIVSFNLKSIQDSLIVKNTQIIVIHVNVPNQAAEKTYSLTYSFGNNSTLYKGQKLIIPAQKSAKIN